eukprot:TRINITY_DN12355_c0_g2_i2.p1 TRINITY_DN12355_c0_g2~~TRINITY_DN12355_c0_g2_i2.p1  ORF type:complete len:150 (-),score=49.12 TRINITY_DN12355_c0_g2_i2:187-636(-)
MFLQHISEQEKLIQSLQQELKMQKEKQSSDSKSKKPFSSTASSGGPHNFTSIHYSNPDPSPPTSPRYGPGIPFSTSVDDMNQKKKRKSGKNKIKPVSKQGTVVLKDDCKDYWESLLFKLEDSKNEPPPLKLKLKNKKEDASPILSSGDS